MKTVAYIAIITFFLSLGSAVSIVKLIGTKRNVVVQLRHEHGAVLINGKKVRVPYTLEQTALPVTTKGPLQYLFLKDGQASFATAFTQLIMCLTFGFICYLGFSAKANDSYRQKAMTVLLVTIFVFVFSEMIAHAATKAWLMDTSNFINGYPNIFGGNATFTTQDPGSLIFKYRLDPYMFITPVFALVLIVIYKIKRDEEKLADYLNGQQLQ
ncbi:MAG: hypothetical protein V4619_09400 [Bacteroidota bacterium]